MKICIVHNDYGKPSGEEFIVAAVREMLLSQGHDVLSFSRSSAEIPQMRFGQARALFSGIYNPASRRALARLLRDKRPDVVHVHNVYPLISPAVLPACRALGVPVVMNVQNYRLVCPNGLHFTHGEVCERCAGGREYWCILRNCEHSASKSVGYAVRNTVARKMGYFRDNVTVYTPSTEFHRQWLIKAGIPDGRIAVIPNMVDTVSIKDTTEPGDYVAFAGRVSPEKGVPVLVKAAEMLPQIPFRIAGAYDRMPDLATAAPKNVQFLGHLGPDQIADFYRNARMLVVPSIWYEGFPTVIPQAMLRGRPILCSRIGGMPDIVEDGRTGCVFGVGDAAELAGQIRTLWEDPQLCQRLGRAGREKALREYSRDAYYGRLMAAFEKAIALGAGGA